MTGIRGSKFRGEANANITFVYFAVAESRRETRRRGGCSARGTNGESLRVRRGSEAGGEEKNTKDGRAIGVTPLHEEARRKRAPRTMTLHRNISLPGSRWFCTRRISFFSSFYFLNLSSQFHFFFFLVLSATSSLSE